MGLTTNKVDANHAQVRDELREILYDATVHDMSAAKNGFPDLCVGWRRMNWLFEVKPKARRTRLTNAQVKFHKNWQGQVHTVSSAAEAIAIMLREVCRA